MRNPFRYVIATTYLYKDVDEEDFDEKLHKREGLIKIDLWEVMEVLEHIEGGVELIYYDGESRQVFGSFSHWCEWHDKAKNDQRMFVLFPALN